MKIIVIDGQWPYVILDDHGEVVGRFEERVIAEKAMSQLKNAPLLDAITREPT